MEYVAGETLERRMGQRSLPLSQGLRYAEQVADALARAHAAASCTGTSSPRTSW